MCCAGQGLFYFFRQKSSKYCLAQKCLSVAYILDAMPLKKVEVEK